MFLNSKQTDQFGDALVKQRLGGIVVGGGGDVSQQIEVVERLPAVCRLEIHGVQHQQPGYVQLIRLRSVKNLNIKYQHKSFIDVFKANKVLFQNIFTL